jgi:hypothetical protein
MADSGHFKHEKPADFLDRNGFGCVPLQLTLLPLACAARWRNANRKLRPMMSATHGTSFRWHCRDCSVGETNDKNAREQPCHVKNVKS